MADTREQNLAGRAPIEPVAGDWGRGDHGMGDSGSLKVDMGQGTLPARKPPARSGAASGAVVLISAVLAIVFGGAGAWAYERYLAQPRGERPAAAAQGGDVDTSKTLARLDDRISRLSDQYNTLADQNKDLQARLEAMPKSSAAPNLEPIEAKVAKVGQLSQEVEAIEKQIDPLHQQVVQYGKKVDALDTKVDELLKQASTGPDRVPTPRNREDSSSGADHPSISEEPENATPATGNGGGSVQKDLQSGISLFRQKRYREAYHVFRGLLPTHPDDARVWYYAALSYGKGSNDWGKITESMVEQGVSHEKAGQPPRSEIDSALAGLTRETGKDWLDSYRQRAR